MKILLLLDSLNGNDSGDRSGMHLIDCLVSFGYQVGVYVGGYDQITCLNNKVTVFPKKPYRFIHNFSKQPKEFKILLESFQPNLAMIFGSVSNKLEAFQLLDSGVPYIFHPLTTEFYCIKSFAGRNGLECHACIKGNFLPSIQYQCGDHNFFKKLKFIFEKIKFRKIIFGAYAVFSHSKSFTKLLEDFGVHEKKIFQIPIFFPKTHLENIVTGNKNYYVLIGQQTEAKGFQHWPSIIKKTPGANFKVLIYNKQRADQFIQDNDLLEDIVSGRVQVVSELHDHADVLNLIASAEGVIITSSYPSTGEFSFLESIGLGKPVFLFDVGVHKDVIRNNINAFLFPQNDINLLCDALNKFCNTDIDSLNEIDVQSRILFKDLTDVSVQERVFKNIQITLAQSEDNNL